MTSHAPVKLLQSYEWPGISQLDPYLISCGWLTEQEFDLAHREQAPERQLAALASLQGHPGSRAANLVRAAAICDGE